MAEFSKNQNIYSESELALRNGQDMDDIWVAYKGQIFDVSNSRLWKTGRHYIDHWSGQDLTKEIELAPHTVKVLQKFEIIGTLKKSNK